MKQLSGAGLKNNKLRNIFCILAIVLTSLLFTTLCIMGMGIIDSIQLSTMRSVGVTSHAGLKQITKEQYEKMKNHPLIAEESYNIFAGFAINDELVKRQTEIRYSEDKSAEWSFSKIEKGRMPQKDDEIATDTIVLDMLGIPHELGQKITLKIKIGNKIYEDRFNLAGYWEGDKVAGASNVYLSKNYIVNATSFLDSNRDSIEPGGLYNVNINFKNSKNIEKNIQTVITDSGYKLSDISYGVNWAYLTTFTDNADSLQNLAIFVVAIMIIGVSGYFIIYSIFQISVMQDIRYYGLLKTIGTTKKQIKKLIVRQAAYLSIIGIPLGCFIGFFVGKVFLKSVISQGNFEAFTIDVDPAVFIGSSLFTLITVAISCMKPLRIAKNVSPIEAVRYTDTGIHTKKKIKNTKEGSKIYKMALANLSRNKKKTALVILSMSLSLVILNSVVTLINGFDEDKYIEGSLVGDYFLSGAGFYNNSASHISCDETFMANFEKQPGVETLSRLYFGQNVSHLSDELYQRFNEYYTSEEFANTNNYQYAKLEIDKIDPKSPQIGTQIYGYDEKALSQFKLIEGNLNDPKFKEGKGIIAVLDEEESFLYKLGDQIKLKQEDGSFKEYEVTGIVEFLYPLSIRFFSLLQNILILPQNDVIENYNGYCYGAYAKADEKEMNTLTQWLSKYTTEIYTGSEFKSKDQFQEEFREFNFVFYMIGGSLSLVLGIIGILNYVNSILTGILVRRREFAMMQSIGMTRRQIIVMLIYEGMYYIGFTVCASVILATLVSLFGIKNLGLNFAFFSYHYTIMPLVFVLPILILAAIFVPFISYRITNKKSIIELLRNYD